MKEKHYLEQAASVAQDNLDSHMWNEIGRQNLSQKILLFSNDSLYLGPSRLEHTPAPSAESPHSTDNNAPSMTEVVLLGKDLSGYSCVEH